MIPAKRILDAIREETENQDVTEYIGIKDAEILRHMDHAVKKIHSEIVKRSQEIFIKDKIYTATGSESYDLPMDCFLGNKVTDVKYRNSAASDYWTRVKPDHINNRSETCEGYPTRYIRSTGKIFMKPQPSTGQIRVSYVYKLPKLDLQRAVVDTATLDSNTNTITTLNLNILTEEVDTDALNKDTYITVVDELGNIKMSNIRFTNINTTTGAVTIHPSHVYEDGETIEPGDIIVSGKYSSTHVFLDEYLERHLIEYGNAKVLQRDGSQEISVQSEFLASIAEEIIDTYSQVTDDVITIPESNEELDEF